MSIHHQILHHIQEEITKNLKPDQHTYIINDQLVICAETHRYITIKFIHGYQIRIDNEITNSPGFEIIYLKDITDPSYDIQETINLIQETIPCP